MVKDELGRDGQPFIKKRWINPPLEALPRVAGQRELLPRACDMLRSKIGAFDQHVGCGVGHTRMFAAHNAADIVHHHVIGDHCHACTECVGLAVERGDLLTVLRLARNERPGEFGAVVNMEWPTKVNRNEIGDINQYRNRLLANRAQLVAHPLRRCPVGHTRHGLCEERRATLGIIGAHQRCGIGACNWRKRGHPVHFGERPQRA